MINITPIISASAIMSNAAVRSSIARNSIIASRVSQANRNRNRENASRRIEETASKKTRNLDNMGEFIELNIWIQTGGSPKYGYFSNRKINTYLIEMYWIKNTDSSGRKLKDDKEWGYYIKFCGMDYMIDKKSYEKIDNISKLI